MGVAGAVFEPQPCNFGKSDIFSRCSNDIITILALYAAAAFRLIPSFNRITEMYNQFKFSIPSLSVIDKELNSIEYDYKISQKI